MVCKKGPGLNLSTKKTRKRELLDEMDRVVPWGALVQIIEPHAPRAKTGRHRFRLTRPWKRRCTTCRCTVNLLASVMA